ncbi:MAG: hypothetical protein MHPSP_001304, partial [Paramarteilia canceri]
MIQYILVLSAIFFQKASLSGLNVTLQCNSDIFDIQIEKIDDRYLEIRAFYGEKDSSDCFNISQSGGAKRFGLKMDSTGLRADKCGVEKDT